MTPSQYPKAIITGASRGIGRAVARELSSTHTLILGTQSPEGEHSLQEEFPDAEILCVDLTDSEGVVEHLQRLDVKDLDTLILSAGKVDTGRIEDMSVQQWWNMLDINVTAPVFLVSQLLPALRSASGQVIFINSGAGLVSKPGVGLYSASKFALKAAADALREEERGSVRVTSIYPGKVNTDMQRQLQVSLGTDPEEYNSAVYIRPETVAATVRTIVDSTPEATVEDVSIRPVIT